MTRVSITEHAKLKQHGYKVEPFTGTGGGWTLLDPEGAHLMIGDYGCIAPTQWEAVAEGLERIAQDQRCEAEAARTARLWAQDAKP